MNVVEVYNTVNKYVKYLRKKYGDNIEYIEAYDGKLIIQFKREYLENKIAEKLTSDIIRRILNTIWGGGVTTNDK